MAFLRFADDAAMFDSTAIDNMFISEFMPAAPDGFLKVYLYARMLCLHPQMGGMEEMQRALNMDDDTIMTAFAYWERAGLMKRVADNPPQYRFLSPKMGGASDYDRDYYKYRDFNGALQALFPGDNQLLHPAQYALANDWVENLGLSQDAVIALIRHLVENSRSKSPDPVSIFRKADKKALQLSDAGATDEQGVIRELSGDDKAAQTAREVLRQLGMRRNPSQPELKMVSKWLKEWGVTMDDIIAACAETVKAQNPSFGYVDSTLRNMLASDADRETMRKVLANLGVHQVVTENHMQWLTDMKNEGFELGTIEFASTVQATRLNRSVSGVGGLLGIWKNKGLFKRTAAEEYVAFHRALREEFSVLLNLSREVTAQEIENYKAWKNALPGDMLAHAASMAAGKSDPVRYMGNVINHWLEAGIDSLAAAQAQAEKPRSGEKVNPALDYEQRSYADMNFEDDSFMEEARRILNDQNGGK